MSISINNLNVRLSGNHILKNIKFSAETGEFISVLGQSGCGKTTLIKSIAGLIDIQSGEIKIYDTDITNLPPEKRETVIVFQDLRLFPNMNVEENIGFSMRLNHIPKSKIRLRVNELLESVKLVGFKRKISELSGGQMQRVALARALCIKPKLLLLDEPFSSRDEELRIEMGVLVKKLHKENHITTLMITHDKQEAIRLSDKIILMHNGCVLQIGSPIEIFTKPKDKTTALMLGDANFIKGEVKNGVFTSFLKNFTTKHKNGAYSLVVRPNELTLTKNINQNNNIFTIKEILYNGEYVEVILTDS